MGYCYHLHLSAHPSVRSEISSLTILRNPTKFGVRVTHINGACNSNFFVGPCSLGPCRGPWGGVKRSNIIKFLLQSQFQRLIYQTLSVFLQIENMKHVKQIFVLTPGSCPRGGLGGAQGVKNLFFGTWSCGISNWQGWWVEKNASKIFTLGSNWWPWGEVKRSNIMTLFFQSHFSKIFIPNFVFVLTNKRHKTYQQNFYSVTWAIPQGWDLRVLGVKNLSVGICDDAPSTEGSTLILLPGHYFYHDINIS